MQPTMISRQSSAYFAVRSVSLSLSFIADEDDCSRHHRVVFHRRIILKQKYGHRKNLQRIRRHLKVRHRHLNNRRININIISIDIIITIIIIAIENIERKVRNRFEIDNIKPWFHQRK